MTGARRTRTLSILLMGLVILLALSCVDLSTTTTDSYNPTADVSSSSSTDTVTSGVAVPNWGQRTKTSGCIIKGPFPDPECTPGDIFPDVTRDDICTSGYARSVRDVPQSEKDDVYAEYGITHRTTGQYEVDHFVSLELGGSNDISNLFPEAANPTPGFHEKDKVENYLHDQVCSGAITLQQAQIMIATNWLDVYNSMPNK